LQFAVFEFRFTAGIQAIFYDFLFQQLFALALKNIKKMSEQNCIACFW
jgi:hypothetical protein